MKKMKVCWISAGVSSFIAGYLAKDVDKFIYIDIDNQHPDSMRFIRDCEKVLNKPIEILKSEMGSVENVIRKHKFINSPYGAKCTLVLKKQVRKKWEYEHRDYELTYVWGFDGSESNRAKRMKETMFEVNHEFPLIENNISKEKAHGILKELGIQRPLMYDLGYSNNNCIGCVKGGMGYWNKIRIDFPEVFERMMKLEREIGRSCIRGVFLDELEPNRGRMENEIIPDCGMSCGSSPVEGDEDDTSFI